MSAYGTYIEANAYFANRLHVLAWDEAASTQKTIALAESTSRIDRLRFSGLQVEEDQDLEFPRYYGDDPDGTEVIPDEIQNACFELAYVLLDGVDPDLEFENLGLASQRYSSVGLTNQPNVSLDHISAGIPSASAWRFLRPFLADSKGIQLNRVT
ncbi:hypothetical protein LCGC14_1023820 [marine sediment metagenome]|uniref:Putative DnaT-like domain-containing protein n=1 Tax=marine sediment metagenome TaxID=412755 RepID=A0A0F9MWQ3_9ZZZZ